MRRVMSDLMLSACALTILIALLAVFDGRVRDELKLRWNAPARATSDIAAVGGQARSLAGILVESAKAQSREHGPLMVMLVAGSVLTLFMIRT